MDVFKFRNQLIKDYSDYVKSFITIRDSRINDTVKAAFDAGFLWPESLVQLNPFFLPGKNIEKLVDEGMLHEECRRIFRWGKDPENPIGKELSLHTHQEEAVRAANTGANYVLTTGTGSGKSLAYIIPIVNAILKEGPGIGIQAIVIYPMNALANSQAGELEKFLCYGYPKDDAWSTGKPPVTFKRYTGQESREEREAIIKDPPDILLTNYVMMELMLTRPFEKELINSAIGLKFLVLDELHTYRGRQGADVALLIRRLRKSLRADSLQCIGTSATMAGPGSLQEQKEQVAEVASTLYGAKFEPRYVITETLERMTRETDVNDNTFIDELKVAISSNKLPPAEDYDAFCMHPLSIWIEHVLGMTREPDSGRLVRTKELLAITGKEGAATRLAEHTGLDESVCSTALMETLMRGYNCKRPDTGAPSFAFRLHQFVSKGDLVYTSLESPESRYITLEEQQYVPGSDRQKLLYPVQFCRQCGEVYYLVERTTADDGRSVFGLRTEEKIGDPGYLYVNPEQPWPQDEEEQKRRLPEHWLDANGKVKRHYRNQKPARFLLNPKGVEDSRGIEAQFIGPKLRFCLCCGTEYSARMGDYAKLGGLGTEGRSTATTLLSLSAIRFLRGEKTLPPIARKLLSFSDNRQDASLQAGHFNDFVKIGLLRGGLYQALNKSGSTGLDHSNISRLVATEMGLSAEEYLQDPSVKYRAKEHAEKVFRGVLEYRIFQDLKKGWRITLPNLEECGLLQIEYMGLQDICDHPEDWKGELLPALTTAERFDLAELLCNILRRELCIDIPVLTKDRQEELRSQSEQRLTDFWGIEEKEKMRTASLLIPRSRDKEDTGFNFYLSPRSNFALWMRQRFPNEKLKTEDIQTLYDELLEALDVAGIVTKRDAGKGVDGYLLKADALIWKAGDGSKAILDPLRIKPGGSVGKPNPFFVDYYCHLGHQLQQLEAREHTAQVDSEEREIREKAFSDAKLPVLYCSPTMELGVDISQLNAVNMRNMPPTPANYAQRSGRAGRSGQPALVFSYCSAFSAHDQYYFRRPLDMVAGAVTPPRLDLANEDLVKAHLHAIWLRESGMALGETLSDLIDIDKPGLPLKASVEGDLERPDVFSRTHSLGQTFLNSLGTALNGAPWHHSDWLDKAVAAIPREFHAALERWKTLYTTSERQANFQHKISIDQSKSGKERQRAESLRREARQQMTLLAQKQRHSFLSDFYSYRYFASEGFLPGYNFPRLPLSAFIPGKKSRDEYLSRARFLAISEFGPRAIIYHEGSKYTINRVILPVRDPGDDLLTKTLKQCPDCGYLHPTGTVDVCEWCGAQLDKAMENMFRMENVATQRRENITSDEEERQRLGYRLRTGFRFERVKGEVSCVRAELKNGEDAVYTLSYGQAATLWRLNLGWRRTKEDAPDGFVLDTEKGLWATNKAMEEEEGNLEDGDIMVTQRVVPFVEDRRNCLVLKPVETLSDKQMATLQAALKNAIQIQFQLEDSELAVEPLPDHENRNLLLFYESSEGGAGVLRQLIDKDLGIWEKIAKQALELCHFDTSTGEDMKRAPHSREDCEASCYNCTMNYGNQIDHQLLDRHEIKDILMELGGLGLVVSSSALNRGDHIKILLNQCGSSLENQWLERVDAGSYRLPSHAQVLIEKAHCKPDFVYEDESMAIFIDGPPHQYDNVQERDRKAEERLLDLGWSFIRFGKDPGSWPDVIHQHPSIFGEGI